MIGLIVGVVSLGFLGLFIVFGIVVRARVIGGTIFGFGRLRGGMLRLGHGCWFLLNQIDAWIEIQGRWRQFLMITFGVF